MKTPLKRIALFKTTCSIPVNRYTSDELFFYLRIVIAFGKLRKFYQNSVFIKWAYFTLYLLFQISIIVLQWKYAIYIIIWKNGFCYHSFDIISFHLSKSNNTKKLPLNWNQLLTPLNVITVTVISHFCNQIL